MLLRAEIRIVSKTCIRYVKQTQAEFQSQNAAHGIIHTAHRHLSLFDKFLEVYGKLALIWHHGHVYSRIDGKLDCLLLG